MNPPSSSVTCTVTTNNSAVIFGAGTHIVSAQYAPSANTWTTAGSPAVTVTVGKSPVSISQPSVAPAPTTYGTNLTYTVTLTPNVASPNYQANTVQFYDNGVPLGAAVTPSSATGIAQFTTANPPAGGTHSITAQFIGDAYYNQSAVSAKLVFTILTATPTVPSHPAHLGAVHELHHHRPGFRCGTGREQRRRAHGIGFAYRRHYHAGHRRARRQRPLHIHQRPAAGLVDGKQLQPLCAVRRGRQLVRYAQFHHPVCGHEGSGSGDRDLGQHSAVRGHNPTTVRP